MSGLESFGGKGANLVRLQEMGFPVPPFAVLPVAEYETFVREHRLDAVIAEALPRGAAEASAAIREAFRRPMSRDQRARVEATIGDLAAHPVAVRSSATAEDLPEASYAGQQDTFLEVSGIDAVIEKVIECWSSLWTERAITYRARNDIDGSGQAAGQAAGSGLGIAVVVQRMIDAEASGVVFTVDPLSGRRDRVVVDAVAGLGEKLVSGQVIPDHYEVEGDRIVERTVQGAEPVLSDGQLRELVALSRRIADAFGAPQDIEFTRVGDDLQIVQSRAITSLFPVPEGDPEAIYISFGAVQGVLAPITPLGQDMLGVLAAGLYTLLLGTPIDGRSNPYIESAGGRLWIRADRLLVGAARPIALRFLTIAEPVSAAILEHLLQEPAYAPRASRADKLRLARSAAHVLVSLSPRLARNFADPDSARARFHAEAEKRVTDLESRLEALARVVDPAVRLQARIATSREVVGGAFALLLPLFAPVMGPSIAMIARLRALAAETDLPDADALAMTILRALPDNVTTAMDLAMYEASRRIASDPASVKAIGGDPADVAAAYLAGTLPPVATRALRDFMARYGMRGVAEIDMGTPRWREQPEQVIRTIQTYLGGTDHAAAYEQGRREAAEAIETLAGALPKAKAAQVRFFGSRLRGLFGLRETPKFTMIRMLGLAREALLASARDLVDAGRIDAPEDIAFLTLDELSTAFGAGAGGATPGLRTAPSAGAVATAPGSDVADRADANDLRALVAERRAAYERERRRTRVPAVLVGDGRAYYSAPGSGDGDLAGTGVSPGVVTAPVRVVHDPATTDLQPGEILVCRGTDPAWTPLFLIASGLITEVGGLMTHGSVVAREYGLPAVVGIPDATHLLATGEVITLDGTSGTITRTPDSADQA
ncbi:MAG: PEP/pyruvate-binding domain-containing protein [Dermatophilus congolensis]|nr:PEP/pyruvate-binding domain-containing protein [Dermatophilus congolensis]